ncbi:hypothetical protein BDV96DRAFT_595202 [Lophiotrema nucula]|uniref:Uncharacterized protein n=1 Tax=Lophiotrema nucula TaxID=690887 RepID=A0A6A5ZR93_9PLEO|nr:hypothetical protein BDV96DRAFT_595202 [Lophiotrema nucula]
MGNLCGKESKDNFTGPGRVLGSAPPPSNNAKASVPARVANNEGPAKSKPAPKVGGPGRTTGSGPSGEDPKAAAAAAAEIVGLTGLSKQARASRTATGDLGKKLEAQKKQTQSQTLQQAAYENRAAREADAVREARDYN